MLLWSHSRSPFVSTRMHEINVESARDTLAACARATGIHMCVNVKCISLRKATGGSFQSRCDKNSCASIFNIHIHAHIWCIQNTFKTNEKKIQQQQQQAINAVFISDLYDFFPSRHNIISFFFVVFSSFTWSATVTTDNSMGETIHAPFDVRDLMCAHLQTTWRLLHIGIPSEKMKHLCVYRMLCDAQWLEIMPW